MFLKLVSLHFFMVAGTDCPWLLYSCEVASENKWASVSTSGWFTFLLQGQLYSSFLHFLVLLRWLCWDYQSLMEGLYEPRITTDTDTVTLGWKMEVSCWQSKHLHPSLLCDHDGYICVFICIYTPFFHICKWTMAFFKIILFCIIHPLLNSSCTERWWLFCPLLPCTASSALICKNDIGENVMMCLPGASPNASPE